MILKEESEKAIEKIARTLRLDEKRLLKKIVINDNKIAGQL
jgi:hypothetical protein